MAEDYVSRCEFALDGKDLPDFKSYEEEDVQFTEQVNLMNKTGNRPMTPRYRFAINYVVPADEPEMDFTQFRTGQHTVSVILEGGERVQWSGVRLLTRGGITADGESEAVRRILFSAKKRRPA